MPESRISGQKNRPNNQRLHASEQGSQLVEFAIVIIPLFAILFLIMDLSWAIFAKATLQEAVREGVRYAVTGQAGDSAIQQLVRQRSFGFIPQSTAGCYISVQYFSQSNLSAAATGVGSNAGGSVVQVSVNNVSISPFGPLWRSSKPLLLSASSSDVMESSPNGVAPSRGSPLSCPNS